MYAYNRLMKHPLFEGTEKIRVSVFLEKEDVAMVKRLAERAGTGQSEVIRRALREGCKLIEAEMDRYDGADEEMQAAIEHEELGALANNPGGDWRDEAMGDLKVDSSTFDAMSDDERTLWNYRVWRRAWELREADESEHERRMEG